MSEIKYKILMHTPLGKRSGTLTASKTGNVLNGSLDILGHKKPFEGVIDETGNCQISGSFITLMHTVSYVATGQISDASVCLKMESGRNTFELLGIALSESEGELS